jgi:hypothetical protein
MKEGIEEMNRRGKIASFFLLIFMCWWYYDQKYIPNQILKYGENEVCVVSNGCGVHNRIFIDYIINKQFYSLYLDSYGYIETGEKFWFKYLPDNPKKIEIDYYRPYIEDTMLVSQGGKLSKVEIVNNHFRKYFYTVNGQSYNYCQFYKSNEPVDPDTSKWILVYRKDLPNIAYIKPKL